MKLKFVVLSEMPDSTADSKSVTLSCRIIDRSDPQNCPVFPTVTTKDNKFLHTLPVSCIRVQTNTGMPLSVSDKSDNVHYFLICMWHSVYPTPVVSPEWYIQSVPISIVFRRGSGSTGLPRCICVFHKEQWHVTVKLSDLWQRRTRERICSSEQVGSVSDGLYRKVLF